MEEGITEKMNYKNESYPESLTDFLIHTEELAKITLIQLNSPNCKKVNELYDIINGKIIRNKKRFDELGYIPALRSVLILRCANVSDFAPFRKPTIENINVSKSPTLN
jgi:hypothetical protein